jgi:hypothetical protein
MNPLEIAKKRKRKPPIALESPLVAGGGEKKRKRVQCGLEKWSRGFIPRGPDLSGEETGLVW